MRRSLDRCILFAVLWPIACASWRPLPSERWEQAEAHRDVFVTRLRVTRLDGSRVYLERPHFSAAGLSGVYPAGWPPVAPRDSLIVIPRDSIASVDRLESDRRRTMIYLGAVVVFAVSAFAWMQ